MIKNEFSKTVVVSNEFCRYAQLEINRAEWMLFFYAISKIEKEDTEINSASIKVKRFDTLFDVKRSQTIKSVEKLNVATAMIKGRRVKLCNECHIQDGEIHIRLSDDMKPYLLGLDEQYGIFQLGFAAQLKSKYAIRLYLFAQFCKNLKLFHSDYESFAPLFTDKYKYSSDFRRAVLLPAINQIKDNSDINIMVSHINDRYYIKVYTYSKARIEFEDRKRWDEGKSTEEILDDFNQEIEDEEQIDEELNILALNDNGYLNQGMNDDDDDWHLCEYEYEPYDESEWDD